MRPLPIAVLLVAAPEAIVIAQEVVPPDSHVLVIGLGPELCGSSAQDSAYGDDWRTSAETTYTRQDGVLVSSETRTERASGRSDGTTYAYDAEGRLVSTTRTWQIAHASVIDSRQNDTYEYDEAGRLAAVRTDGGYGEAPDGQTNFELGYSYVVTDGRVTGHNVDRNRDGTPDVECTYTFDASDLHTRTSCTRLNVEYEEDRHSSINYEYDSERRLMAISTGNGMEGVYRTLFSYDCPSD